jgi:LPS-assembly lipoprotein
MWSSERRGVLLAALCGLSLAGCDGTGIHPLYMSHNDALQAELSAIVVDPIPDRLGHYLGDKLQTDLNGTGAALPPRYHLVVLPRTAVQTPLINTVTSTASAGTVVVSADWRLIPVGGGAPLFTGTVTSAADYSRSLQRFANIRAARDAEIRDADTLADQITQQVASKLAAR